MTVPALSVVVPVLNEEACIEAFLEKVSRFLDSRVPAWEIIVVDDGSTDTTVAKVERRIADDPRVRLVRQAHRGKGAALRAGMRAARGLWRFMSDADLSVAPEDWGRFLDAAAAPDAADIIVGSREAPGSRRIGEPALRHVVGRVFNKVVQLLAVSGINDTQCGFKLLRAEAAETLFPILTIEGFAFDVELLFLARRGGFSIQEVGVTWVCRVDSRVKISRGAAAFGDVARIRLRQLTGGYPRVQKRPSTASARASSGE